MELFFLSSMTGQGVSILHALESEWCELARTPDGVLSMSDQARVISQAALLFSRTSNQRLNTAHTKDTVGRAITR